MIARLIDAISGFDKKWEKKCRPAPEKRIQKLKKIVESYHFELPDAYLRYLRAMGKNDAGLLGHEWDGNETDIDTLLDLFDPNGPQIGAEHCLKRGFFLFSHNWASSHFFLNLSGKEPQVVEHVFGNSEGKYVAGSFEKYLFRQAFKKYRDTFAHYAWDSRDVCNREREERCRTCVQGGKTVDERMEYVQRLTQEYGLEGAWFGDRANFFWYNEKSTLEIHVQDGFKIRFSYHGPELEKELYCLSLEEKQRWLYQFIASQEK